MTEFYSLSEISDELIQFAVIVTRYDGSWVFCRHHERNTWEIPGGHRELGESILDAAKRELFEETGAIDFLIEPIGIYSTAEHPGSDPAYGLLCYAEIRELGPLPAMEMEEIAFFNDLPEKITYRIYEHLFSKIKETKKL